MTAIDLTHDQCAALANFLRRTVDRGMDSGYDEIELLVLAQRALRSAAKPTVRVPLCDVPKSGTPEGGGYGERCAGDRPTLRCIGGGPVQAGHRRPAGGLPLQVGPGLHGPSGGPVRRRRERRQADPDVWPGAIPNRNVAAGGRRAG